MPIVLKSRSVKLLEPSGPVQACNGTALHLPLLHEGTVYSHFTGKFIQALWVCDVFFVVSDVSKDRGASIFKGQEFQVISLVLCDNECMGTMFVRNVGNL